MPSVLVSTLHPPTNDGLLMFRITIALNHSSKMLCVNHQRALGRVSQIKPAKSVMNVIVLILRLLLLLIAVHQHAASDFFRVAQHHGELVNNGACVTTFHVWMRTHLARSSSLNRRSNGSSVPYCKASQILCSPGRA